uniref:Uncharacterized protein n=3 Tax=Nothobranchius TaxID=28779 RepID=A0A1A7ZD29_NOTFU
MISVKNSVSGGRPAEDVALTRATTSVLGEQTDPWRCRTSRMELDPTVEFQMSTDWSGESANTQVSSVGHNQGFTDQIQTRFSFTLVIWWKSQNQFRNENTFRTFCQSWTWIRSKRTLLPVVSSKGQNSWF